MKNKKITYLLIVLVVAVWGVIIYRILGSLHGSEDDITPIQENGKKEVYNDYAMPKDTEQLHQNYRDPFGLVKMHDTVPKPSKSFLNVRVAGKVPQAAMNWDFIRYVGYIRNPGSKKLIAMIHLNGQEVMLGEGETAGQVKLLKNLRDSIKINYNGKIKFIIIKPGNL